MQTDPMKWDPRHGSTHITTTDAETFRFWCGEAWKFNPWNGTLRKPEDVEKDPFGYLITEGESPDRPVR